MSDVRWLLFAAETEEHIGRATSEELRQLLANAHVTADNPAGPDASAGAKRRLLIGRTHGGRVLTVVIEGTLDPTTWLPITAWEASRSERRLLERSV